MNSGTAVVTSGSDDRNYTNFTFVAENLGCGNVSSAVDELNCMREVPVEKIEGFLQCWSDGGHQPSLIFNPIVDNRTKFENYTARALAGNYSKLPAIIGTNVDKGRSIVSYTPSGVNIANANATTLNQFLCPADQTTTNRFNTGSITYRYLYAGNFSNVAPQSWLGAYHSSELPLIFGTSQVARGANTPFETELSELLQDYWLAFAVDPEQGLLKLGWPLYEPGGSAVEFGKNDQTLVQNISVEILEGPCQGPNPTPEGIPPS